MESVPGAVATGLTILPTYIPTIKCDPVATAPGTDSLT